MAKSIRSKHKRRMRKIKRERYAVKELRRLKDMLGIPNEEMSLEDQIKLNANVITFELPKPAEVDEAEKEEDLKGFSYDTKGQLIIESDESSDEEMQEPSKPEQSSAAESVAMEHSHKRIYNPKTMQDQNGSYPPWFKSRDIKKMRKKIKLKKVQQRNKLQRMGGLKKKNISKKSRKNKKDN